MGALEDGSGTNRELVVAIAAAVVTEALPTASGDPRVAAAIADVLATSRERGQDARLNDRASSTRYGQDARAPGKRTACLVGPTRSLARP